MTKPDPSLGAKAEALLTDLVDVLKPTFGTITAWLSVKAEALALISAFLSSRDAEAREALEFYANGWGYLDGNRDMTEKARRGPCREWEDAREHIPVMRDFGAKARAALAALRPSGAGEGEKP